MLLYDNESLRAWMLHYVCRTPAADSSWLRGHKVVPELCRVILLEELGSHETALKSTHVRDISFNERCMSRNTALYEKLRKLTHRGEYRVLSPVVFQAMKRGTTSPHTSLAISIADDARKASSRTAEDPTGSEMH